MSYETFELIGNGIMSVNKNNEPVFYCPSGWQKAATDEILITAETDTACINELRARGDMEDREGQGSEDGAEHMDANARNCSIVALGMPYKTYLEHKSELLSHITGNEDEWKSLESFLAEGNNPRLHILYPACALAGVLEDDFLESVKEYSNPKYIAEIEAEINKLRSAK